MLCEWVLCGVQLLPCLNLRAVSEDGSSCLGSPVGSTAAQDCKMASGKLGSGHRDFPFLTIIGNGTTQPRHSLNTLYGIQQTRQEHPSASSSEEGAGWVLHAGQENFWGAVGGDQDLSYCFRLWLRHHSLRSDNKKIKLKILASSQYPQAKTLEVEGR